MDFLKTIKSPSPVFPNDQNAIVTVRADASVSQGFQALIKNNVLSAPVFDESKNTFIGMLSMRDVVYHALRVIEDVGFEDESIPATTFLTEKDHFRNYKVQDIIGKEKLIEVGNDLTVDKVVKLMVQSNVHRVICRNPNGSLNNIITQSRIVECLFQLFDISPSLAALGQHSVQELSLAKLDNIVSICETDKALQAFRLMRDNSISGLPVVDAQGKLVGNISESDLQAIQSNAQYLKLLFLPITEYLSAMHKHHEEKRGYVHRPIVKCELDDTYRQVVERIYPSKVHRCYVVDATERLIGVISLQNILSVLVKFSPAP